MSELPCEHDIMFVKAWWLNGKSCEVRVHSSYHSSIDGEWNALVLPMTGNPHSRYVRQKDFEYYSCRAAAPTQSNSDQTIGGPVIE